jgi:hypothetical protein
MAVVAVCALGASAVLWLSVAGAATGASSITGDVYNDVNRNAARDAGESPFSGELIELYDASSGSFVNSVYTDTYGHFAFRGIADGTYVVRFDTTDYNSLRASWVPTTTGSLRFERTVDVAGSATADIGLRQIVRSTTLGSPISAATASNGTRFESYDDVVDASTLLNDWLTGSLLGAEPANTVVRFDVNPSSSCVTSVSGTAGTYSAFSASVWLDYVSWLETGDRNLFHEYGHAWTTYYEQIVQQEDGWTSYLAARGLTGDPRLNSNKNWDPREMIAEDYRQLFGSPTARAYALYNADIPPAASVPGLADWMRSTFTQPVASESSPPPGASPSSSTALAVTALAVNPTPMSTQGPVSFTINAAATVTVRILDASGAVVRTLLTTAAEPSGVVDVVWDRKNDAGRKVKAGTYTVTVQASDAGLQHASATASFKVVDLTRAKK